MVNSIDQALITQFQSDVHRLAAQSKSRLRGKVMERSCNANTFTLERFDNDGLPIEVTGRHEPTVVSEQTHSRRQVNMKDFKKTLLLDEFDDLQVLIDPEREYADAVVKAMMRQFDKQIIEAATATVTTGRTGGSTVTFAADGGQTVTASSGLTYEKLLEVKENFIKNDVGVDMDEKIYLLISEKQHTDLMKEAELTSGDFMRDYFIEQGYITRALGMEIVMFGSGNNAALPISGSVRQCLAFSNRGVCAAINKDIGVKVNERPDLNNAMQIQATFYMNALRTEGELVQKINVTES